jgi:hypothetical protein
LTNTIFRADRAPGSAVAVAQARQLSLGADTAGSGRVPAALNNIDGWKPTRGALSAAGVVPACRTLDCVSTFALTCGDALDVMRVVCGYDPLDPFSRVGEGLAPPGCVLIAVVGAHLSGQPLNWQLTDREARLVRTCRTAANYRLYALTCTAPPKLGLIRDSSAGGPGIEVEVWAMPETAFGSFVAALPPTLSIGSVELEDGSVVKGFLREPFAIPTAQEITALCGWRNYLSRSTSQTG